MTDKGTYVSETGEDFAIVPFEGKSAEEIYQTLAANIGSTFNDPSKVMSGIESSYIKIRAYSPNIMSIKIMGIRHFLEGYFQLEFKIRDGRVRVSSPFVERQLRLDTDATITKSYTKEIKKYFKNGVVKENKKDDLLLLETNMNVIINAILGGHVSEEEDNW